MEGNIAFSYLHEDVVKASGGPGIKLKKTIMIELALKGYDFSEQKSSLNGESPSGAVR